MAVWIHKHGHRSRQGCPIHLSAQQTHAQTSTHNNKLPSQVQCKYLCWQALVHVSVLMRDWSTFTHTWDILISINTHFCMCDDDYICDVRLIDEMVFLCVWVMGTQLGNGWGESENTKHKIWIPLVYTHLTNNRLIKDMPVIWHQHWDEKRSTYTRFPQTYWIPPSTSINTHLPQTFSFLDLSLFLSNPDTHTNLQFLIFCHIYSFQSILFWHFNWW